MVKLRPLIPPLNVPSTPQIFKNLTKNLKYFTFTKKLCLIKECKNYSCAHVFYLYCGENCGFIFTRLRGIYFYVKKVPFSWTLIRFLRLSSTIYNRNCRYFSSVVMQVANSVMSSFLGFVQQWQQQMRFFRGVEKLNWSAMGKTDYDCNKLCLNIFFSVR